MNAAAVRAVWDAQARRYGAQEFLERHAISAALRLAAPAARETVVDLATGTGAVLRALASSCSPPAVAVGVDQSPRMLARVGPLPAGWSTVEADAREVRLPDGFADVVICSYLLHLLSAQARREVLREARRLLRRDAVSRIVVVTLWADRRRLGGRLVHAALEALARARPGAWGALMPLDPTDDLRAAGFRPDRRVVLSRGGYPSLVVRAAPLAG